MKKILMVCLGNICRSPMAEGILRHVADRTGLMVHIDSAGTSGHHRGERPDARAIKALMQHGIDISAVRSRPITPEDLDQFDHIFVMDQDNYRNVMDIARNASQKKKVKLILEMCLPGQSRAVPDPWYGKEVDFHEVYHLLLPACEAIAKSLQSNKK